MNVSLCTADGQTVKVVTVPKASNTAEEWVQKMKERIDAGSRE